MRSFTLAIAFHFAALPAITTATDWPQHLGPHRNGTSIETGWNKNWDDQEPEIVWKTTVGNGCSGISVGGGRACTLGNNRDRDTVFCFDALTGKKLWSHTYPQDTDPKYYDGGPSATPTMDGDRVYTVSKDGDLFCFDAVSGDIRWQKNYRDDFGGRRTIWGYAASPLVHGDLLIIDPGGAESSIVALDKLTGETVWQNGSEEPGYASPVYFQTPEMKGFALFQKTALTGYDVEDGAELFRIPWETEWDVNASIPIYYDGGFFLSSGYATGNAYVKVSPGGETLSAYRNKDLFLHFQAGVLVGNHVFAVSGDNNTNAELKCVHVPDGEVAWTQNLPGNNGSVIHVDDRLILLTEHGELRLLAPSTEKYVVEGAIHILSKDCWAAPAFANGYLYARNNDGKIVCVDMRK